VETFPNFIKITPEAMRGLYVAECNRWLGVTEIGGNNKGQLVELFQRSVSIAKGDPWCAAFVFFCLDAVEKQAKVLDPNYPRSNAFKSGHCLTIWNRTPESKRVTGKDAVPGDLVVWNKRGTTQGHIGVLLKNNHNGTFQSIEGNTSNSDGFDRDGGGVYLKNRLIGGYGVNDLLGFIRVFG
jgi:hypothetical protein